MRPPLGCTRTAASRCAALLRPPSQPLHAASSAATRRLRRAQFAASVRAVQQLDAEGVAFLLRRHLPMWIKVQGLSWCLWRRGRGGKWGVHILWLGEQRKRSMWRKRAAPVSEGGRCRRRGRACALPALRRVHSRRQSRNLLQRTCSHDFSSPSRPTAARRLGARRAFTVVCDAGLAHLQPNDLQVRDVFPGRCWCPDVFSDCCRYRSGAATAAGCCTESGVLHYSVALSVALE